MKWTKKKKLEKGDKRTIRRFLFLPLKINEETRWLEMVNIEQEYDWDVLAVTFEKYYYWYNVKWGLDDPDNTSENPEYFL